MRIKRFTRYMAAFAALFAVVIATAGMMPARAQSVPAEGYYYVNATASYAGQGLCSSSEGEAWRLSQAAHSYGAAVAKADIPYVFKIAKYGDYFSLENVATGKYFGRYADQTTGGGLGLADSPAHFSISESGDGYVITYKESDAPSAGADVLAQGDGYAAFGSGDAGSVWTLEKLDSAAVAYWTTTDLQAIVDSYPYGADDYVYGTQPGQVGDYDAFAAFSNTYNDALQLLSKSDATDAELAAMADKLRDAKAVVDAAINPVTDGVYYIESAATMFAGKDTMVWYGPRYDNYPGWAKRVTKVTYMWKIQKLADGNYSIQNFGNGQYVSHTDVVDGTNSHMHLTDALQTEQQIDFVSPDGQFNIHSAGAKWVYNAQDHKNGSASVGWIASYSSKAKGSEGAWRIVRVSDADLAQAEADRNRDVLHQTIAATGTKYVLGTDPGQYSETAYNSFIEVRTSSLDMVKDTTGKYTETDFAAALSKFKAAHEALLASINPITDGYYSISTVPYADLKKGKSGLAFTQNGDAAWLYGFQWDVDNPAFLWQIKKVQGGYSVQNYISKLYINSTDLISAGASINLSKTQTTAQVFTHTLNDEFQVSNTVLKPSNFGYVAIGDLVYIAGGGISFYLHKFSDEEVAKIAEAYPQQLRTDTLKNLIAEMSAKTGVDSVYTMNMESPLLTDASQIYISTTSLRSSPTSATCSTTISTLSASQPGTSRR